MGCRCGQRGRTEQTSANLAAGGQVTAADAGQVRRSAPQEGNSLDAALVAAGLAPPRD